MKTQTSIRERQTKMEDRKGGWELQNADGQLKPNISFNLLRSLVLFININMGTIQQEKRTKFFLLTGVFFFFSEQC